MWTQCMHFQVQFFFIRYNGDPVEPDQLIYIYIYIKTNVHLQGYDFFYQKKKRMDRAARLCGQETQAAHEAFIFLKSCVLCDNSGYLLCV